MYSSQAVDAVHCCPDVNAGRSSLQPFSGRFSSHNSLLSWKQWTLPFVLCVLIVQTLQLTMGCSPNVSLFNLVITFHFYQDDRVDAANVCVKHSHHCFSPILCYTHRTAALSQALVPVLKMCAPEMESTVLMHHLMLTSSLYLCCSRSSQTSMKQLLLLPVSVGRHFKTQIHSSDWIVSAVRETHPHQQVNVLELSPCEHSLRPVACFSCQCHKYKTGLRTEAVVHCTDSGRKDPSCAAQTLFAAVDLSSTPTTVKSNDSSDSVHS